MNKELRVKDYLIKIGLGFYSLLRFDVPIHNSVKDTPRSCPSSSNECQCFRYTSQDLRFGFPLPGEYPVVSEGP